MKKIYPLLLAAILSFFVSCSGDDEMANLPPSEVISVSATTKENTIVTIAWGAAEDPNGDPVYYDVLVNDRSVATKTTNTTVDVDVAQFLNRLKGISALELKRGVDLELTIKIQAYDDANNVSDEVVFVRSVFVNRVPGNFEFNNIYFDYYSYNYIGIEWSPATDADGDILSYDIYINDNLIKDNYIIGSDSYDGMGRVEYNQNFFSLINDDIIIKVIADDQSGGTTEITKTFKFTDTDVNLGSLSVPYENTYSFSINNNEPDGKIGYTFSISEATGFAIVGDNNSGYYRLRNTDGNIIYEGSPLNVELIQPGNYYFEIEQYNSSNGSFDLILKDSKETDIDLGSLPVPSENEYSYTIPTNEPDNKLGYHFSISESTGLSITDTSYSGFFYLKDGNGNYINQGNPVSMETLQPGNYYVEVENYNTNSSSFSIILRDAKATDITIGALATPSETEYAYTSTLKEPDNKIGYSFSTDTTTGLTVLDETFNVYFELKDANGNYIYSGSDIRVENLSPGTYNLEIQNYNNNNGSFKIILKDAKATNSDLGLINTLPYSDTLTFDSIYTEADYKVRVKFEVDAPVTYTFQTNANVYLNVLDANGNYLYGGYNNISDTIGSAGIYYIEIYAYDATNDSGTLNISLQ